MKSVFFYDLLFSYSLSRDTIIACDFKRRNILD